MYRGRAARSKSPANARARSRSRSVARNTTSSGMKTHDEHGNMIDDAAVSNFVASMDSLPSDEWRARTMSFESLIESLPKVNEPEFVGSGITPWYRSHTALRRLHKPLSDLLLDARSTVAKHTCQHLAFLIRRIKALNPPNADTCKYLLKDLLPSVLALHSQTVKVIKGYALDLMTIIIPLCRFKSGLPVMLERLRKDKSRDVREACIKYLRLIIRHWAKEFDSSSSRGGDSGLDSQAKQQQEYLTPSICLHIGNGLARALMDPSQSVRMEARNAFEIFRYKYPDIWNQIVQKKDGILSKDLRLKKSIMNAAIKADAEGRSDLSKYYPSYDEGEDYDGKSVHSNGSKSSWHSKESFSSKVSGRNGYRDVNPKRSTSRQRTRTTALPKRIPGGGMTGKNLPPSTRNGRGAVPTLGKSQPVPKRVGGHTSMDSKKYQQVPPPPPITTHTDPAQSPTISEVEIKGPTMTHSSDGSDLAKELRNGLNLHGSEITQSTSSVSEQSTPNNSGISKNSGVSNNGSPGPNENYQVANQLLSSHKSYIDELMESLRTEMDTVREFERLLLNTKTTTNASGLYGPSEDEVLQYFETVYGFLEKGTENGTKLREAMEKISRTEFQ